MSVCEREREGVAQRKKRRDVFAPSPVAVPGSSFHGRLPNGWDEPGSAFPVLLVRDHRDLHRDDTGTTPGHHRDPTGTTGPRTRPRTRRSSTTHRPAGAKTQRAPRFARLRRALSGPGLSRTKRRSDPTDRMDRPTPDWDRVCRSSTIVSCRLFRGTRAIWSQAQAQAQAPRRRTFENTRRTTDLTAPLPLLPCVASRRQCAEAGLTERCDSAHHHLPEPSLRAAHTAGPCSERQCVQ